MCPMAAQVTWNVTSAVVPAVTATVTGFAPPTTQWNGTPRETV